MPILTSTQKGVQFSHVMKELLQRHESSSFMALALQDYMGGSTTYMDMDVILSLTDEDIELLEFEGDVPDPSDNTKMIKDMVKLPRGERALLKILMSFYSWRKNAGQTIQEGKWTDVAYEEFHDYRVNHHWVWLNKRASLGIGSSRRRRK